jgi:hypothetical protein
LSQEFESTQTESLITDRQLPIAESHPAALFNNQQFAISDGFKQNPLQCRIAQRTNDDLLCGIANAS